MKPTKNHPQSHHHTPNNIKETPTLNPNNITETPTPKSKPKFHGFTLVELIVVITILAILGTIGFLSIGGYSSRARDSARVTDIAQIQKSLDLSVVTAGDYPTPDNAFAVTYSGGVVWYQGTVGPSVLQALRSSTSGGGINKKPVDPLRNTEYTYSELAEGKAYMIKADFEGELPQIVLGPTWITPAYAAPGNPTIAYIQGNYGGLTAKTTTGGLTYVLALPSIITSTGTTAGGLLRIEQNALSGTLLFHSKALAGASTYNPNARANSGVVFSGASLPTSDTNGQLTSLITSLKAAYSGSDVVTNTNISSLLATNGTSAVQNLGTAIISNQLGGKMTTAVASSGGGGGGGGGGSFTCGTSTVSDADNNTYNTVQIGSQCWMKENLRTTKKPDGTNITKGPAAHGGGGWSTDVGLYSCPPNTSNDGEDCAAAATYGLLYQWSAAMNGSTTAGAQGICPAGWHVPTDAEWKTLVEGQGTAGCEGGNGSWCSGAGSRLGSGTDWLAQTNGMRQNASNATRPEFGSSGFNAQPSGNRNISSNYPGRTYTTYLWSSSQVDASSAWQRSLSYSVPSVNRGSNLKAGGYSLRCIQG